MAYKTKRKANTKKRTTKRVIRRPSKVTNVTIKL